MLPYSTYRSIENSQIDRNKEWNWLLLRVLRRGNEKVNYKIFNQTREISSGDLLFDTVSIVNSNMLNTNICWRVDLKLSVLTKMNWRRKWKAIPRLFPGKFQGQMSLVGYSPWVTESDTTEHTRKHTFQNEKKKKKKKALFPFPFSLG